MPTYITLFKWTDEGAKTARDTLTRTERNAELAQKMGGRLLSVYWTQGEYDTVAVTEWPDEVTAQAYLLEVGSRGVSRTQTMRAFNKEEMQRIVDKLGTLG